MMALIWKGGLDCYYLILRGRGSGLRVTRGRARSLVTAADEGEGAVFDGDAVVVESDVLACCGGESGGKDGEECE